MANNTSNPLLSVRGTTEIATATGQAQEQIQATNPRGDTLTAAALPERSELVRMGYGWGSQIKAANALTLLITIPTTRAEMSLQNATPAGNVGAKVLIIDRIWVKAVTSMAAANYLALLAQIVPAGTALVADSANATKYSLSGKGAAYTGVAQMAIASTATGCLTDQWDHVAFGSFPTTTSIAAGLSVDVYGRYIVPPQGNFSISVQQAVSGGTAIMGMTWFEVPLVLGHG